ncbi:sigma-70 family RNA polymerase sigma factor [Nocardiopsis sp. RSe5-2]|uniref:RNA polymerase sigma factor n=1 Tax=Nocardiopsis endophytica TaxID=3018445 RepID=A0ABT4UAR9_9ACTN|nr:sigma-70 family RNA polymerase sigma factor [Nocardiopsis endophytica]MDA2813432.1 sigma-70 family RNA polymerase sigma factor [Nocardiopsis endophytica]
MNDEELTALAGTAGRGDGRALEVLIAETREDLARFIAHRVDPLWVEELTQETYMRAMTALPGFAGRSSVRTWLKSIARRAVADRYRWSAARPRTTELPEDPARTGLLADRCARFEEEVALGSLLAGISPERRRAFVLTRIHGYSYAEAADELGVPVGTVRSRVARARSDLIRAMSV